jgi:dienelactone hydrolase
MLALRHSLLVAATMFALAAPQASQQPVSPAPSSPATGRPAPDTSLAASATELSFHEALVVGLVGSYGRSAVPTDLVLSQLAAGAFKVPVEGDAIGPDDRGRTQAWARLEAGKDGWFQNRVLSNAYLYFTVTAPRARTMILDASGFYVARINGEPRGGEKYGTEIVRHPVKLRAGKNAFLFQVERGKFRGRLVDPAAPLAFTDVDATLPDVIVGEPVKTWAGVRLVNATEESIETLDLTVSVNGRAQTTSIAGVVSPLTTRKLAIPIAGAAEAAEGPVVVVLKGMARAGKRTIDIPPCELKLRAVAPTAHHVRTFVSESDGSVQYFGVAPWTKAGTVQAPGAQKPALVLSLHGAGVEGAGQARAYKPKDWAWIVAATNRRPYGFDWEDWGRLDAMEVLAEAQRLFGTDDSRTYLTGHSMGGHGTWQVGATLPDHWAAIAPSAGWHSFSSYGGGPAYKDPTPVEKMLVRANQPGETLNLARNLLHYGVYVLHGDKDDNVPVTQARTMRDVLGKFHPDFAYYERPGAGHWWGDECVDWPPLFEFLAAHRREPDSAATRVEFVTANPAVSSASRWLTVLGQLHPLEYSRATIERDPKSGALKGTTENVTRIALALPVPLAIDLDGSKVQATVGAADGRVYLQRSEAGAWQQAAPPDPGDKGPQRGGGFKDVFRHQAVLVFGTRGTAEDTARAYQKARFDAESFWYRGNGSLEVVADTAFDPARARDRNVVLYGNADTNACWKTLLGTAPVLVANGRARVGDREFSGADLGVYFVRPRPDSPTASVGAVAWTGAAGWVAASPIQYFVSGAGFPDLMLFSASTLRSGTGGIRAIGWFGWDWSVGRGEWAWN